MSRRRLIAVGVFAVLAVGAVVVTLALLPESPERERFNRVELGMTHHQVSEILGDSNVSMLTRGKNLAGWKGPDAFIVVEFDHDGRVADKRYQADGWFATWQARIARAWR